MIVVTGGAGFIGSHLAEALARYENEAVTIIEDKRQDNFVYWRECWPWLRKHASEITAIYHLGAISSTMETNEEKLFDHNVWFTHRLWDWCAQHDVPIIYASSAATYGNGFWGFKEERFELLLPLNAYARWKHYVDRIMLSKDACLPRPPHWYGLKFFNVYGPGEEHKGHMRSVVSKLYDAAINGRPMELFEGSGERGRDFVHVDDCVDAMLWLMEIRPASGIYNVGTGKATTFFDVAFEVSCEVQGAELRYIPMPEGLLKSYQSFTEADISKLRGAGYDKPFRGVRDGIKSYFRAHEHA